VRRSRAAVEQSNRFGPASEKAIADIMIKRRDKIVATYLPAVNPIVDVRLENGRLVFANAAVAAGVHEGGIEAYRAAWFEFDNATGATRPLAATSSTTTTMAAPRGLPSTIGSFIAIDISANVREYEAWARPVRTYFRLDANGWKLVGLDRIPESSTEVPVHQRAAR
jgi:hypothetical protein